SMRRDIDTMLSLGADAIVLGVLDVAHAVDFERTRELTERAAGTPITFHKAFDVARDQLVGLDALMDAGVARVLTSGGPHTALEGADQLARLVERSAGRISIMAGGSVRGHNAREIVERSGVPEVHARCNTDEGRIRDIVRELT
ncbi:MAG TPA: copper homeostasis protein CutC, partial [Gemmatimonadaceae bacterium]